MKKVTVAEEFERIDALWSPRQVGELNGQLVKFVRLKGQFEWHKHTHEDEMFWVIEGRLTIRLRDKDIVIGPNEFFIIPRGVEHMPVCEDECRVMLFEPAATKQYGD
ncbi:MAG: cupin domain-containing protein [Humidesulfovibrio sp.]|nr:cupin domain-containing protein [Humidesulfovibrio sp.]